MMEAMGALIECPEIMEYDQAQRGFSRYMSQGLCYIMQDIKHLSYTSRFIVSADIRCVLQCIASGLESLHLGGFLIFPHLLRVSGRTTVQHRDGP